MKAVRSHDYRIDGYGNVNFIKVDIGSGHSTFKVFWRRERSRKRRKRNPDCMAKGGSKPFGKARSLFLPDGLFRRGWARRALLLRQGVGATEKDPIMRFTRFPRGEQPSPPSARRVAAAKRAVQAEKDRYPLLSRAREVSDHRKPPGGHAGAPYHLVATDHYRPAPSPASFATGRPARCQDTLSTSLACCATTEQGNAVFGTPWPNCADSN
jgi:hypothetical protein